MLANVTKGACAILVIAMMRALSASITVFQGVKQA